MDGIKSLSRQCLFTLLILNFIISQTISLNHNREQRDVLDSKLEIPITEVEASNSSDSIVIKAVDIPEELVTYEGSQVWRVVEGTEEKKQYVSYLQEIGDVSTWMGNGSAVDVLIRPNMISQVSRFLRERHINFDVIIPDVQQAIDQENPPLPPELVDELEGRAARYARWKGIAFKVRSKFPRVPSNYGKGATWFWKGHRMEWTTYHRLEDIHGYLDYLAQTFPQICSVMSIGTSVEGRSLKVIRISNNKPGTPAIWIDGGIHAREWISPASVTYIINYLVENSETLDAEYYILPVVNPDGYEYTFRGDRLWRKNRNNPEKGGVCIGVDLNRNYGYRWGGLGTSKQPCREIFAGSGPFSEPETNAIKNFFEASAANFKAYLSFHSYGQYILYPWGYDRRVPPDYSDLDRVGQKAAVAMKTVAGNDYTVGNSASTLYAAAGGSDDWAKAIHKIKYTYTIELQDKGRYGFVLPARYIIPTAKEALEAVKVITEASMKA